MNLQTAENPCYGSRLSVNLSDRLKTRPPIQLTPPKISVREFDFWYGDYRALKRINLDIPIGQVTAFIGPSGCGKSTLLKSLNRMHAETVHPRHDGKILMRSELGELESVHAGHVDPPLLRRRFGWVAQKPNPFADSVYENIAYPARLHGLVADGAPMDAHVEVMLRRAGLWDELADRLLIPGNDLSGGQQQRLCIARALSTLPEVLLMDEPCGSLDPISTEHIERLIDGFREQVTIVLVTHNMEQAARVADRVAFFTMGHVLEQGDAAQVLNNPQNESTRAYLEGRLI